MTDLKALMKMEVIETVSIKGKPVKQVRLVDQVWFNRADITPIINKAIEQHDNRTTSGQHQDGHGTSHRS